MSVDSPIYTNFILDSTLMGLKSNYKLHRPTLHYPKQYWENKEH